MSILIRGMEMPKTCGKCQIKNAIECNRWKLVRSDMLDRHKDCPIISVPPHGDLIDRDVLISNHTIDQYDWSEVIDVEDIWNAPIVLKAEEE